MGGRRPSAAHVLLIEVDLVTAADIEEDALGGLLLRLATAGLHGMVSCVRRAELDGREVREEDELPDLSVSRLRPPPDERLRSVSYDLDRARARLAEVLGRPLPSEQGAIAVSG